MSPSNANKKGVRYRYYVSQAVLQKRKEEAGGIARFAAPDIEHLVIAALRHQIGAVNRQVLSVQTSPPPELSDRDLVALHVERIVLRARRIDITLRSRASPKGRALQIPVRWRRSCFICRGLRPAPRLERASPGSLRLSQISIWRRATYC
jgi:site-specific DNA recombinase